MVRIVIFANGMMTDGAAIRSRLRSTDRIFCANGGTRHALDLGLAPEAIIGDLDSLSNDEAIRLEAEGVAIYRHPVRKDKTDLELALEIAVAQDPDEILLVTALGGRLDQMLANILLLTRPEYGAVRLTLADGPQLATLLYPGKSTIIRGQPGDILSLIPLTPLVTQVNLTGTEWPLEKATLSLGSTLSISNVLTTTEATVQIGQGMVLLVHLEGGGSSLT